jgi:hypothetical protein
VQHVVLGGPVLARCEQLAHLGRAHLPPLESR